MAGALVTLRTPRVPTAVHSLDYEPFEVPSNRYEWELENERARMLRRRFLWFCGTLMALAALGAPFALYSLFTARAGPEWTASVLNAVSTTLQLTVLLLAFRYARKQERKEKRLYRIAFWLVVGLGLYGIVASRIAGELGLRASLEARERDRVAQHDAAGTADAQPQAVRVHPSSGIEIDIDLNDTPTTPTTPAPTTSPPAPTPAPTPTSVPRGVLQGMSLGVVWWSVFSTHMVACLFLPWTAREASRPACWLVAGAMTLVTLDILLMPGPTAWWLLIAGAVVLPPAVLPGIGWCWWRHSKFRTMYRWRFESDQLRQLRQELDGARKIHESSLPPVQPFGPLRLSYVYEPMQEIGGDLIFVHPRPPESDGKRPAGDASFANRSTMVLLDVTGHGIAAALTVNRLVGELERLFAERPDIGCAEVMAQLNRYVYLTLATHGVFVTGLALCVECGPMRNGAWRDPYRVTISNAGHPPAFLRRIDGSTQPLESGSTMLGVLPPEAYDAEEESLELQPGEAIVAYTDGAAEATNDDGRMIGIDGVRRLVERVAREPIGREGLSGPTREVDGFHWPDRLIRRVAAHRGGPPDDDTLIAVVYRPPASAAPARDEVVGETVEPAEMVDAA